jgi:hypothetical protein
MLLVKLARDALSVQRRTQQLCTQKVLHSMVKDTQTEWQGHWFNWALLSRTLHGLRQTGIAYSDQQWYWLYLGMAKYRERPWVVWGGHDWVHCKMDSSLCPTAKIVSGQTNILTMVIGFVDTPGKHIDLIKQEATSCSHCFAGIRASTTTNSIKYSSKRNYLRLCWWAKT